MIRVLTIVTAVAALAVSAAPASAGTAKAKAPRPGAASFTVDMATEKLNLTSAPKRVKGGRASLWFNYTQVEFKPKPKVPNDGDGHEEEIEIHG